MTLKNRRKKSFYLESKSDYCMISKKLMKRLFNIFNFIIKATISSGFLIDRHVFFSYYVYV